MTHVMWGLKFAVKIVFALFAISLPLAGVWGLSSLAASTGAPTWVSIASGLFVFPLLPLLWEAWARRRSDKKPMLTTFDRFVLRTLTISTAFLAIVLSFGPVQLFGALTTRGDWMFDSVEGERGESLRDGVLRVADRLEWLHDSFRDENPYADLVDDDATQVADEHLPDIGTGGSVPPPIPPAPIPAPTPTPTGTRATETPTPTPTPTPVPRETPTPTPTPRGAERAMWPTQPMAVQLAKHVPASAGTSFEGVARYFASQTSGERPLARAIHDWVALNIAYDAVALAEGRYPPQDAQTVFSTRKGVCAGYAQLFRAMAMEVGLQAVVVVGDTRDTTQDEPGHAWNAVRVDGEWYLMDVTWDAGYVEGRTFTAAYKTDYLFAPAYVFGIDHIPDEARWQLRSPPLTRGEFARQLRMRASFFAQGFELPDINRSQVEVRGDPSFRLNNHHGRYVSAGWESEHGQGRCEVRPSSSLGRAELQVDCDVSGAGVFDVTLFSNTEEFGTYTSVGTLQFVVSS